MKSSVVAVSALCTILTSVLLQQTSTEGREDPKLLFESKCSICHSIERPKSQTKTKKEWETTVMRMKNVNRAPITEEEARSIIDFLAKNYGK